ncbi:MAG TPA: TonB-dependent receptor [Gemmatimonadota bacterium]|nr:TonB-dependent receptor [Gemmatimonadota bacterium]
MKRARGPARGCMSRGPCKNRFSQGAGGYLALCVGLCLVAPVALGAQETPEPGADNESVRLPALRVDVRRSLFDPGLARSVERLEPARTLFPFRDLGDWLASRTGVGVRGPGAGGRQLLSVRGGRPEGVLVLLDGLPLNDPLTGEADLSSVPLSSLESATLVRGAGAARYGSGALGGALLLESSPAVASEPAARFGLGSYGAYEASGSAGWSGQGAGLRVAAGIGGADNDFPYEDRLAGESPTEYRENADSETRWLNVAGEAGDVRGTLRFDGLERGVPGRMGTNAFAGDRWRERRWALSGQAAGERTAARLGIRGLSMRYAPGDGEATDQRALDARAGAEVALPGSPGAVVAGRMSYERLEGDGIAGVPDRLSAGATLRTVVSDADATFGIEPLVGFDMSGDETALSPELGAWLRPGESVRLYGRLGRAYRVPTFADLHFEAAPGLRANPDLESERVVLDAELGVEASTASTSEPSVSVRLSAWTRDTRRPIVWLASSGAVWSPRNLDRLAARGLEIEARLAGARSASTGWAVDAGLTLQRSRLGFGSNRNPLPYEPDVTARVAAELRRGATAGRLEATYVGSRTTSVAATRRLASFVTLDAVLRHRFTPGPLTLDAAAGIDNLLDRQYELVELFPEPGRSFRLTVDIR